MQTKSVEIEKVRVEIDNIIYTHLIKKNMSTDYLERKKYDSQKNSLLLVW